MLLYRKLILIDLSLNELGVFLALLKIIFKRELLVQARFI